MKKAFTLVELLVVVVVLVTLMGIMFRIGAIGSDSQARNETVSRLQRLEFALSGYNAAFGTYPPVRLHGSRNIYLRVDSHGLQNTSSDENTSIWGWYKSDGNHGLNTQEERDAWDQVKAACRSQPVGCEFPFPEEYKEFVQAASERMQAMIEEDPDSFSERQRQVYAAGFDDGVSENRGRHNAYRDKMEWRDVQLFRFGVMSFLLPRYLFMMNGDRTFFEGFAQWNGNNTRPSDPLTGESLTWSKMQNYLQNDTSADLAHIANIPSQAVCARWMPTFEKSLCCNHKLNFFGVDVKDDSSSQSSSLSGGDGTGLEIHSPGGYENDSTAGQYALDGVTMKDGWGQELYYYSPPPYQNYVVWSSGKNKRTFPPWISRDGLDAQANKCVSVWVEDDIVNLSN